MTEVDPSQSVQGTQNEIKSEENAPINVKVCVFAFEGVYAVVGCWCRRWLTVPSYLSHAHSHSRTHPLARTHAHAGRQLDGGRSLFQNQAKYKVEQAAGSLCGQGGQGCIEHSVRLSLYHLTTHLRACGFAERGADARSRTGSCTTGTG